MLEFVLNRARRVRHVLDAWCVAVLCLAAAEVPRAGLVLGELCGMLGILTALRLIADGRIRLGLWFTLGFALWLLFFPLLWLDAARQPSSQPVASTSAQNVPQQVFRPTPASSASTFSAPRQETPVPSPPVELEESQVPDASAEAAVQPLEADPVASTEADAAEIVEEWWLLRRHGDHEGAAGLHGASSVHDGKTMTRGHLARALDEGWRKGVSLEADMACPPSVTRSGDLFVVSNPMRFSLLPKGATRRARWQALHVFQLGQGTEGLEIVSHSESLVPALPPSVREVNGIPASDMLLAASACLEADLLGNLRESAASYAERVSYFGKTMTREQVSRDKAAYFDRWPDREEAFFGEMAVGREPGGRASCAFSGNFRTESEKRGEWQEGVVTHFFVFERAGGRLLIVSQSGKVTHITKGKTDERE